MQTLKNPSKTQKPHLNHKNPIKTYINNLKRDNPCEDEMEEWLASLLDSNFHLVCEDDSCFEVARHLVQVNRLVHRKDHQKLLEYCEKLPKVRLF
jgi:formate dehydrogenase maturation protein FdhE